VLKTVAPSCQDTALAIDMLEREAEVGTSVAHANLAPILASSLRERPYYLIMPYVEGTAVRTMLDHFPQINLVHALWIARQTAEALAALHASDWMHCDVKPQNMYLSTTGHAMLLDLGLAQPANPSANRPVFVGTPTYTAPEWFSRHMNPSSACDIYSLGVTLFEMLTGALPRPAIQDPRAPWQAAALNPRRFTPQLPPRVARVLRQMLANEPLRRPAAADLVTLLCDIEIDMLQERMPLD
jgi:serine/threonine-protein kinase